MFEKILKELKTKYKDLGLSEVVLKVTAEKIAKTVKEESEIEAAAESVEGQMKIYQSFADQNRTLQTEIKSLKDGKKPEEKTAEQLAKEAEEKAKLENEGKPDSEKVPAWATALIEANKKLSEGFNAIQQKETNLTNSQKLDAKLKELKVSDQFSQFQVQGKTFANDEEIEAFATQLQTAETAYKQSINDKAAEQFANPVFGTKTKEGEVSADVQSFIDQTFKPKTNG